MVGYNPAMTVEKTDFGFNLEPRPKTRKNQVLGISEIKIGDTYTAVNNSGAMRVTVLTLPHRLEDLPDVEGLFMDVEEDTSSTHAIYPYVPPTLRRRISLADFGVIPYGDGQWNSTNHLLKVSKE